MKKIMIGLVTFFLLLETVPVAAKVNLTMMSQIDIDCGTGEECILRNGTLTSLDREQIKSFDIETGTLIRKVGVYTNSDFSKVLDISHNEEWTVIGNDERFDIYNQFGEHMRGIRAFSYNNERYELGYHFKAKFLPNSSTLVIVDKNQMFFYDVKSDRLLFVRGIDTSETLQVSKNYIAVGDSKSVRILNHAGQTVNELIPDESIVSFDLNESDVLTLNVRDGSVYQYKDFLQEPKLLSMKVGTKIDLSEDGMYLGSTGSVYDLETGKKIYTNLIGGMIRFNAEGTRLLTMSDEVNVYQTTNLAKRIASVQIDPTFAKPIENTEWTPALIVTSKNGVKTKVTGNIVWRTDKPQVLYISQGKIKAKMPGTATLKATFEDHEATLLVTVQKDPRPSDEQWLKQEKAELEKNRSFLKASFHLYDRYSKVSGVKGKLYFEDELYTSGIFNDRFLYGTYRGQQTIDEIVLPLSYEKRPDITYAEVKKVFGKPRKTSTYYGLATRITRDSKKFESYSITKVTSHWIKKKHVMEVYYDEKGNARYFHLFINAPEGD